MIIKKSASWIQDYRPMSLGMIQGSMTHILDKRVNDLILLRDEMNKEIQAEIDFIYDVVARREMEGKA